MPCPRCGAALDVGGVFPGGSVTCACGARVAVSGAAASAPPAPPVEPLAASVCPRCSVELAVEDAGGVVVSACPGGHGVFVTDAALEELAAGPARVAAALDPGAPAAAADTNAPSSCPRCAEPMVRRPAGGDARVIVDTCADHGTWFDAGELRAALAATRTDRSPDAVDPDALSRQSKATLDVALALDEVREGETVRRAVDVTEDVLGMFSLVVLGKSYRPRRRRW